MALRMEGRLALLLVLLLSSAPLFAETTFTYQGQLKQSGLPYNGVAAMSFRLHTGPDNSLQVGQTIAQSISVTSGLFQAELDFGNVFNGEARWLEIDVDGVTLTPRQPITSTPYAVRALNVATVEDGALAGTYSGELTLTNDGNKFAGRFDGNGENLIDLNASNIATGTLADARLSSNIPLLDASNIFLRNNIFQANVGVGVVPSASLRV